MKKNKTLCIAIFVAALACLVFGVVCAVGREGTWRTVGMIFAAFGAVALIVCVAALARKEELTTARYARKKSLLTPCEIEFLQALKRIEANRCEVLYQVALVSVIDKKTQTAYRNELFRIIDYAFVDRRTYAPLLLVELNDSSHLRADRKLRDEKVAEICRKAKMPLVTFTVEESRDFALVKKRILSKIL